MSELILSVEPSKDFVFKPNMLEVKIRETNLVAGTVTIDFLLKETTLDNSRYVSREWVDKGTITASLNLIANARNEDGTLNAAVINQFLSVFNLQLKQS